MSIQGVFEFMVGARRARGAVAAALVASSLAGCTAGVPAAEGPAGDGYEPLGTSTAALATISDCDTSNDNDLTAALNEMRTHWSTFEAFAADEGFTPSACLKDRIASSGTVRCVTSSAMGCSGGRIGWTFPGWATSEVCDTYLDTMQASLNTAQARSCIGALAAHELSHGCYADESRAEQVERATRKFLNSQFGTNATRTLCQAD